MGNDLSWTDPQIVRAWDVFAQLRDEDLFTAGYLADDYPTAANIFITEQAPFMTMGAWLLGMIESTNPDLNFGVMPFPTFEDSPGMLNDLVTAGLVVTVTTASEHPVEAKRFLEYLMSEEAQQSLATDRQGFTPYDYDTSDWDYAESFYRLTEILDQSTSAAPFLDMIEDQSCNVPWVWQASQGILSGALDSERAAQGHEDCVVDLRAEKGFE